MNRERITLRANDKMCRHGLYLTLNSEQELITYSTSSTDRETGVSYQGLNGTILLRDLQAVLVKEHEIHIVAMRERYEFLVESSDDAHEWASVVEEASLNWAKAQALKASKRAQEKIAAAAAAAEKQQEAAASAQPVEPMKTMTHL